MQRSGPLIDALRDSGLLEEEALREVSADLQRRFADPRALAAELVRRGWLTSYQADQLLTGNGRGLVLGQYILLERLGEGGMGQVFKARHRLMKRVVALKVIHPDWLSHRGALQRFQREIQAIAQLSHPNMVIAHDADQVGDTHFLVMEYVAGVDLGTLVQKSGPLPVGQACEYTRQAAVGLQHAHERGLVHRDIKPSNLLVTGVRGQGSGVSGGPSSLTPNPCPLTPVVKILDMGLARLRTGPESVAHSSSTALTQEGAIMGTADFISPEQAADAHAVDIRADLYSLGCTFYFLLTGQPPFPGGSFMEKLFKHKLEAPRPARALRPDVPAEVAAILDKLLAKLPEDRYQTPAEAAAALAPFCDDSGPSPVWGAGTEVAGSRPTPTPLEETRSGLGALLPASGVDLAAAGFAPAAPPAVLDTERTVTRPPGLDQYDTLAEIAPAPAVSPRRYRAVLVLAGLALAAGAGVLAVALLRPRGPDGEQAHVPPANGVLAPGDGPGKEEGPPIKDEPPLPHPDPPPELLRKPPRALGPLRPAVGVLYDVETRSVITRAAFSADGTRALASTHDTVWLYDLHNVRADRKPLFAPLRYPFVQVLPERRPLGVALGPAGDRVLLGTLDRVNEGGQIRPAVPVLTLWEVDRSDPLQTFDGPPRGDIGCVALSPAGPPRALSGGSDNSVCVWDLERHDRRFMRYLTKHTQAVEAVAFAPDGRRALSGSRDRSVCLWDLEGLRHLHTFEGHERWVNCVAFAPDGQWAVSGSDDATARLWSVKDPARPPLVLKGHGGPVRCATVAPDGRHALTGGDDATVRLWELKEGREVASFKHDGAVVAVAFAPDGRHALSTARDNTIRRWELPE